MGIFKNGVPELAKRDRGEEGFWVLLPKLERRDKSFFILKQSNVVLNVHPCRFVIPITQIN